MSFDKGAITGHFITFWGVPTNILPRQLPPFGDFAILEFAPIGVRRTWRYATNGMSSKSQFADGRGKSVRTEIYACSMHRVAWVQELLVALATYPFLNATYLSEFDSIDAQRPIDQGSSHYTGVLFVPPGPIDPEILGLAGAPEADTIIHQVVGLLPKEIESAARGGSRNLWDKLRLKGEPTIDSPRS